MEIERSGVGDRDNKSGGCVQSGGGKSIEIIMNILVMLENCTFVLFKT